MADVPHAELRLQVCGPNDAPSLLSWIKALAAYEGRPSAVTISESRLRDLIRQPAFEASFITLGTLEIGYTVTFPQTSTYSGKTSLYLEDIFLSPEHRGQGRGAQVMRLLAKRAHNLDATTLSWSVLRTNREAIRFYEKLGATPILAWGHYAIDIENL